MRYINIILMLPILSLVACVSNPHKKTTPPANAPAYGQLAYTHPAHKKPSFPIKQQTNPYTEDTSFANQNRQQPPMFEVNENRNNSNGWNLVKDPQTGEFVNGVYAEPKRIK